MIYFLYALQIIAGLGILNVWFLRFHQSTAYRGGSASNMKEEFAHYGLPGWSVSVVGALKVISALGLLVGLFLPVLVVPSAILLALLMIGAILMHIKVGDAPKKSLPGVTLLIVCLAIIGLAYS